MNGEDIFGTRDSEGRIVVSINNVLVKDMGGIGFRFCRYRRLSKELEFLDRE